MLRDYMTQPAMRQHVMCFYGAFVARLARSFTGT